MESGGKSRQGDTLNEEITTCSTQKSDHEIKKLWKKLFWGIEFLKKEGNVVDRSTFL